MTHRDEIAAILQGVALFPEGANVEQINQGLSSPLNRRTLQRRLADLVSEGRLIRIGNLRSSRYKLPSHIKVEATIELSPKGKELQSFVTQPIEVRKKVGYNRKFLELYQPNKTRYLTDDILDRLYQLGRTDGERAAGTYARQIYNRLLIDLSWNSSRLEGNTYSLLETERLLKSSQVVEGKDLFEAQMILNHKEAIEFLVDSANDIGVNRFTILNLHGLLSNDLLGNLESCGRLRTIAVGIGRSVYCPLEIPQLIEEVFYQILDKASAIINPFEQAFFLMVHLPYLQPFEDVNKRVSRLAANIPLIKHNLCPLSFVDMPQDLYVNGLLAIYELNQIELFRDVFVWAYERSCLRYSNTKKELGDPDPFRVRYRPLITEVVAKVVRDKMGKTEAVAEIKAFAEQSVPSKDRTHFLEEVEKDLMSLHEGNIARHKLRLSEFTSWQQVW